MEHGEAQFAIIGRYFMRGREFETNRGASLSNGEDHNGQTDSIERQG
jgi:hypothetical protein